MVSAMLGLSNLHLQMQGRGAGGLPGPIGTDNGSEPQSGTFRESTLPHEQCLAFSQAPLS